MILEHSSPDIGSPVASDGLIVLGKNFGIEYGFARIKEDPWNLSLDSRITALAAGILIHDAQASEEPLEVTFTTGRTAGKNIPPESKAQIAYMLSRPGLLLDPATLDKNHVTAGERGFDTVGDAEEAARVLSTRQYKWLGLLTTGYHGPNALKVFESRGVHIDELIASEEVVASRSPGYAAFIEKWASSDRIRREIRKEETRSRVLAVDPKGRSIHALAWMARRLPRS